MITILPWKLRKNIYLSFGPDWLQIQPQPKAIADWHSCTDVVLVHDERDRLFDMERGKSSMIKKYMSRLSRLSGSRRLKALYTVQFSQCYTCLHATGSSDDTTLQDKILSFKRIS